MSLTSKLALGFYRLSNWTAANPAATRAAGLAFALAIALAAALFNPNLAAAGPTGGGGS
ncbi:MAG: hypothetical protein HY260_14425 [Chloroflexi bacterium]|nr:hypothetical protein [Chloroflexota bacterium]